jgi:hypothetical protein
MKERKAICVVKSFLSIKRNDPGSMAALDEVREEGIGWEKYGLLQKVLFSFSFEILEKTYGFVLGWLARLSCMET